MATKNRHKIVAMFVVLFIYMATAPSVAQILAFFYDIWYREAKENQDGKPRRLGLNKIVGSGESWARAETLL